MKVNSLVVNVTSEQPQQLTAFYRDVVGLAPNPDGGFIRSARREPWGGVISTFLDPDGNYCQLIEYKAEAAS